MGRLHLEHLLLIRVRVSELQNCEIGPVADFLSMKALNNLLANLRRFEPVIRSERVDFINIGLFGRPCKPNPTTYSLRVAQNLLREDFKIRVDILKEFSQLLEVGSVSSEYVIQLNRDLLNHSFFGVSLIHRDSYCQDYPGSSAVRYARAICISA